MVQKLAIALTTLMCITGISQFARAADEDRIQQLEKQMQAMQQELTSLKEEKQKEQEESERRTGLLAENFEKLRTQLTIPEEVELKSLYGLGPAASKIYQVERGLSIGGYGEAFYRKDVSDKTRSDRDTTDFLRFVLYTGYKFSDWILLNAELEFEHATTGGTETSGGGSVSVEFAYLDFLLSEKLKIPMNVRLGMMLVPMGIVNELHEPVFFNGIERPELERRIIPSTWRENGIGIWGQLTPQLEYRLYGINGLNAKGFRDNGFRGGRQKGNRALAEDIAVTGRLDYRPLDSLTLGASFYHGNSGQDQKVGEVKLPDASTTIWELHGIYRNAGLELRGLFAMSHLGDAAELTRALREIGELSSSRALAQRMFGGYFEAAYDILPWLYPGTEMSLSPFVRFSYLDLQDKMPGGDEFSANGNRKFRIWTPGVSFKPHPQIVLKLDYRNFNTVKGMRAQEVNFGMGFVF